MTQLALHRFESIVHDFCQRLVRSVIHLFLLGHELMPGWHRNVDTNTERISLFVGVIRLLDRDVAAADVIAELVEPGRFIAHHLLDPVRFHQAAVADIHRQLHNLTVYTPKAADAKLRLPIDESVAFAAAGHLRTIARSGHPFGMTESAIKLAGENENAPAVWPARF